MDRSRAYFVTMKVSTSVAVVWLASVSPVLAEGDAWFSPQPSGIGDASFHCQEGPNPAQFARWMPSGTFKDVTDPVTGKVVQSTFTLA